jgi:hypothetical protein
MAPATPAAAGPSENALLSEAALAEDWDRPEEDEAWSHLQAGAIIPVQFPFFGLSRTKLRPAVVLADAGRGDPSGSRWFSIGPGDGP